ncbi:MAG TPA: porin family protein [Steroidobacteraceae bacterium]|nr:porin family protein [Steroidobacteraceae bacterium]
MNMKFAAVAALGALSLAAIAPQAAAADNGFYIGAGITTTDFDMSIEDFGSETLDDNGFKVIAGFRPLDWLAVEVNYMDLGDAEFDDGSEVTIESRAITASALFIKEWQVIDIYARLGMAKWDSDFNAPAGTVSDDGWEPTYGVGIGAHFGSVGIRAEWEQFSTEALDDFLETDLSTISLSVTYTFL